jgi:hypothetical protein
VRWINLARLEDTQQRVAPSNGREAAPIVTGVTGPEVQNRLDFQTAPAACAIIGRALPGPSGG